MPAANKVLPKAGVKCSYDTFVLNRTLVFQINSSAETPRLRQYPTVSFSFSPSVFRPQLRPNGRVGSCPIFFPASMSSNSTATADASVGANCISRKQSGPQHDVISGLPTTDYLLFPTAASSLSMTLTNQQPQSNKFNRCALAVSLAMS